MGVSPRTYEVLALVQGTYKCPGRTSSTYTQHRATVSITTTHRISALPFRPLTKLHDITRAGFLHSPSRRITRLSTKTSDPLENSSSITILFPYRNLSIQLLTAASDPLRITSASRPIFKQLLQSPTFNQSLCTLPPLSPLGSPLQSPSSASPPPA